MRAARSRVGLLSSLESAGQGVSRCVQALPVSARALKTAGAVATGAAGVLVLRLLVPRRRAVATVRPLPGTAVVAPKAQPGLGRYLISETFAVLLLPLLRHYLLGGQQDTRPAAALPRMGVDKLVSRLLRLGR